MNVIKCFRLNPYGCLPTGHNEGLIEIVTKASTLATIQRKYSDIKLKAAFNKQCLYQWLKKQNITEKRYVYSKIFTFWITGWTFNLISRSCFSLSFSILPFLLSYRCISDLSCTDFLDKCLTAAWFGALNTSTWEVSICGQNISFLSLLICLYVFATYAHCFQNYWMSCNRLQVCKYCKYLSFLLTCPTAWPCLGFTRN